MSDCSGCRWLYGLKTKDDLLKAVQKWYSDIAELRELHNVCVVIRDNAGENKSSEVIEFFESKGIKTSVNRGVLNLSIFFLNLSKLWGVLNLSKFCLNFF